jgi:branched-chain amino acid transport system permease protein
MATNTTTLNTWRDWIRQPQVAFGLIVAYVAFAVFILITLDRRNLLFPLFSTCAFPPFVLSPFVILASSLSARTKASLILLLILIVMPIIGVFDGAYLELAIQICIFSGLALGLNIVVGFAGLLDLGYIAFFAVGAYVWGMFTSTVDTYWATQPVTLAPFAWIIYLLFALWVGVLLLKPRRKYYALWVLGYIVGFILVTAFWNSLVTNLVFLAAQLAPNWLVPSWAFYLFIVFGIVIAGLVGVLLGLPVLRLRGDYLAIVTLGFGEMIRVLARNLDAPINFTNGSQGLSGVARPPLPTLWVDATSGLTRILNLTPDNIEPIAQQLLFYFIAIVIIAVLIVVARRLENSPIGRAWTAIREDEVAAIAMGVPLVRMKLLAFAAGAAFSGAIGVLYGAKQTFVSPESFSLIQSISILAMVIVGGMGGIRGVILGAMVVTLLNLQVLKNISLQINALRQIDYIVPIFNYPITDWPSQLEPAKYERLVFGLLLILMMIFRPAGLLPEPRRKMELQNLKEAAGEITTEVPAAKAKNEG